MGNDNERANGGRPATLLGVMQEAISDGLRSRYKPDREIPYALLVIMMQLNEERARDEAP